MSLLQLLRPTLPILIGASLMLTLSMGLRQSLGIFLQPLTHDVGDHRFPISRWRSRCRTSPGASCSRSPAR